MSLSGSDKYRDKPAPKKLTWKQEVIQKANQEIPIEDVLLKYHNIIVPRGAVSWKVQCPWSYEHPDGGLEKQFRIYSDSNSGWCFKTHGRVDNLKLYRDKYPYLDYFEAAKALLDQYEIEYRQKSYQEVFAEISEGKKVVLNYNDIVEAMRQFLNTIPAYEIYEYDPDVVQRINEFNSQVKIMCESHKSLEEIQSWYRQQKTSMVYFLSSLTG